MCRTSNIDDIQSLSQSMSPHSPLHPPTKPVDTPMSAYTNPAFHPPFISRIPKPAPMHPTHGSRDPSQPLGHLPAALRSSQQPLEELPSTSQMQPAPQQHALPAVFEKAATVVLSHGLHPGHHGDQEAKTGNQHSGPPQQQVGRQSAPADQQRHASSAHLFHQPGHEVVSVVSEDATPSSRQQDHPAGASEGAATTGEGMHAWTDVWHQQGQQQEEEDGRGRCPPSFGESCRRLVAVIEV